MNLLRLISCLIVLMLMAGAAQAQMSASRSAPNETFGKLLREADALIKIGKHADAYNLLEPKESDYSGEIDFDYLLGIAALDSGKPDRATIAFERILILNPNFAGARIDLARAYLAMGSDDLAQTEFETVLTQSPPDQVKAVVEKFLGLIEARRESKIQQLTGYLEVNAGQDSNVTAATPDFTSGVLQAYQAAGSIATGSSVRRKAGFSGISGGLNFNRLLSEERGLSLFVGADFRQRSYAGLSEMSNQNIDLRAGFSVSDGADNYRVFGTFGQFYQSGFVADTDGNRSTPGISGEWRRSFSTNDQMTLSLQYTQPRYTHAALDPRPSPQDTNQVSLTGSWLHVFEGNTAPLVFANLNHSVDKALRPLYGKTSNMDRTTSAVMAHLQFTPLTNTDLFLSAGVTIRNDDSPNSRSLMATDFYARDVTKNLSIGFTLRPWTKWTIKGAVTTTVNDSNLSLYQYNRTESTVSLRNDF